LPFKPTKRPKFVPENNSKGSLNFFLTNMWELWYRHDTEVPLKTNQPTN